MKSFQSYLKEQLLLEGQYEDMLKNIPQTIANDRIRWAKQVLKKQDRITWYLRLVQWEHTQDREALKKSQPKWAQFFDGCEYILGDSPRGTHLALEMAQTLEHFYSLNIAAINSYIFDKQSPWDVREHFLDIEDKWREAAKRYIPESDLEPGDDEIIKFSDGNSWWLLPRESCSTEGKAMGHCGNTAAAKAGAKILSLRELHELGEDKFYEPHLTFILEAGGMLGEMKGYANNKPAPEYHPHIVRLLQESRLVLGIAGGGYQPEANFHWDDLQESQKKQVLSKNPEFLPDLSYLTPELVRKKPEFLKTVFNAISDSVSDIIEDNFAHMLPDGTVVLKRYKDIFEVLDHVLDYSTVKWWRNAHENLAMDVEIQGHEFDEFLKGLPADLDKRLRAKYNLNGVDEDGDELDIVTAYDESDNDDLKDVVRMSIEAGYQSGTYDNFKSALDDIIWEMTSENQITFVKDLQGGEYNLWDQCFSIIPLADLLRIYSEMGENPYDPEKLFYDYTASRRNEGFEYSFDEKAAYEALKEYI